MYRVYADELLNIQIHRSLMSLQIPRVLLRYFFERLLLVRELLGIVSDMGTLLVIFGRWRINVASTNLVRVSGCIHIRDQR